MHVRGACCRSCSTQAFLHSDQEQADMMKHARFIAHLLRLRLLQSPTNQPVRVATLQSAAAINYAAHRTAELHSADEWYR